MIEKYFLAFVPIFFALDAIGMVPVFISLTRHMSPKQKNDLIRQSTATAIIVALGFLAVGRFVFNWLGITISDFLVAGGAVLFIISIRDVLNFDKKSSIPLESVGVVPLAIPLMVGPAVLTSSLLVLGSYGALPTIFSIFTNIFLCMLILKASSQLSSILGEAGSMVLSKISNLLLAAIGVMLIRRGLSDIILSLCLAR